MLTTPKKRRRFYAITALILIAIIGSAIIIVAYEDESYVRIEVSGTANASFVVSYDSTSVTLSASESATVEVLPHSNVTITAEPVAPFIVIRWDVSGATVTPRGQNSINFLTGQGGSSVHVSAELAANSSASG